MGLLLDWGRVIKSLIMRALLCSNQYRKVLKILLLYCLELG
jgi:hypothetical protein